MSELEALDAALAAMEAEGVPPDSTAYQEAYASYMDLAKEAQLGIEPEAGS